MGKLQIPKCPQQSVGLSDKIFGCSSQLTRRRDCDANLLEKMRTASHNSGPHEEQTTSGANGRAWRLARNGAAPTGVLG